MVETLLGVAEAENAEQAEDGKEANTPAPRREGRSCQLRAELLGHAQVRISACYARLAADPVKAAARRRPAALRLFSSYEWPIGGSAAAAVSGEMIRADAPASISVIVATGNGACALVT